MDFNTITFNPELKRIPEERDTTKRVTTYGADNLYPQRIKQVLLLSPVAKSSVQLLASFIRGDGFERGDKVLNEKGETANDILKLISEDEALYNGYGLHINSTGLGIANSVEYLDFDTIRLGLKNSKGNINDCRVSINWQQDDSSLPRPNESSEKRFVLYDKGKAGGEAITTAQGMVLYSTPRKNTYPLASIDSIIETCQSEYQLQLYELSQLTSGFLNLSIFKYPSGGDSEVEEEELRKKLNGLKGARNANSIIVAGIDEDAENTSSLVETIPALNGDTMFTNTTLNIKNRILNTFALPNSLLGMLPLGTLFSAQQIADDYTYMNLRTKDIRNQIERVFNEQLDLNLGSIVPNQFESSQMMEDKPLL